MSALSKVCGKMKGRHMGLPLLRMFGIFADKQALCRTDEWFWVTLAYGLRRHFTSFFSSRPAAQSVMFCRVVVAMLCMASRVKNAW